MGLDSLYCGKWRKVSKSRRDLDLDQTMPNIELVRAIFIYHSMFKFQVVYTETHTQTDRHKDRWTDRQTHTHTHRRT